MSTLPSETDAKLIKDEYVNSDAFDGEGELNPAGEVEFFGGLCKNGRGYMSLVEVA